MQRRLLTLPFGPFWRGKLHFCRFDELEPVDPTATGLAVNDPHPPETPWYQAEDYRDLTDDERRIAAKWQSPNEAVKGGIHAHRLVSQKVNQAIAANPGLLRDSGLEAATILKEFGAVDNAEALAEYGGPWPKDYHQKIQDSYDAEEEAELKTLCVTAHLLPHQIKALFAYRETQMRKLDRLLREQDQDANTRSASALEAFQTRDGWAGDAFKNNLSLCERAARQFGDDALADRVKGMREGKSPFDPALVNVLYELGQARVKEADTITGERTEKGTPKQEDTVWDFPEMDQK